MSSSMARMRSQSSSPRWIAASDWRLRSGRGRKSASPRVAPLRALLPFLLDQEAVGQHHQDGVAMEAIPAASLILIPSQQGFGILMKALDLVPPMGVVECQ
jgi:hypothetical protein